MNLHITPQDYLLELLTEDESPISEALFKRATEALRDTFGLTHTKAAKLVQTTLKGLYSENYQEAI